MFNRKMTPVSFNLLDMLIVHMRKHVRSVYNTDYDLYFRMYIIVYTLCRHVSSDTM